MLMILTKCSFSYVYYGSHFTSDANLIWYRMKHVIKELIVITREKKECNIQHNGKAIIRETIIKQTKM